MLERYAKQIVGSLSCFDRIIITGTIPGWCHPQGMASYLASQGRQLFEYAETMKPFAEEIDAAIAKEAAAAGLTIEWVIRPKSFRKEERIQAILADRGDQPGLVHIFKVLETGTCFVPWRDKATGHTTLRLKTGKCAHYYIYFIDPEFGLGFLRIPTWAPFRFLHVFQALCGMHRQAYR